MVQIRNTHYGYIVEEWLCLPRETHEKWHPLVNFGERQSDAKEFVTDIEEYSKYRITLLAKSFNPDIKYKRISSRIIRKEK